MNEQSLAERTRQLQQEVILNTAAQLFAEQGPSAVTMRKIASNSKTSTTVVYNLFGNKQGIIKALFLEGYTRFQQRFIEVVEQEQGLTFLLRICELLWDFSVDHPHYYRIIHGTVFPGFSPGHMKKELPDPNPRQRACDEIRKLQDEGKFPGLTADRVMISMYSLAIGTITTRINGLFPEYEVTKELYLEIIEQSLRALAAGHQ